MNRTLGHLHLAVSFVLALALTGLPRPSSAASPPADAPAANARAVMEKILGDVLVILRDPHLSRSDKGQKVRQIAYDQMDFQTLSRLTMGRHWRGQQRTPPLAMCRTYRGSAVTVLLRVDLLLLRSGRGLP